MEVSTREVAGVLIVDCFGQIPEEEDELKAWRKTIRESVSGESGSIIFHFHDADRISQIQLGYWISALHDRSTDASVSIVSKCDVFQSIFNIVGSFVRVYETEEKALQSGRR